MNCLTDKFSLDKSCLVWYNIATIKKGMNNMYTINPNFITYLKSRQRSENTIKAYVKNVEEFFNITSKNEQEANEIDTDLWMNYLSNNAKNTGATICRKISALKTYYHFLNKYKFTTNNPFTDIDMPKKHSKKKHYMNKEMIHDMLCACSNSFEKAIVLTLVSTGLRISELLNITIDDYYEMKENGGNTITIVGKGNKPGLAYFSIEAQEAIDDYIKSRNLQIVHCNTLFVSRYGNKVARNNLSLTLKKIAKKANIPFWEDMCNHQMRSASATCYLESGMSITELQAFLRHENPSTTMLYTKTCEKNISDKVMNMSFC